MENWGSTGRVGRAVRRYLHQERTRPWPPLRAEQRRAEGASCPHLPVFEEVSADTPPRRPTCVRAQVALEGGVAGEGAVALAADVAAHARVDLHVLLQRTLRLEALPAQQAEDGHVRACGDRGGLRALPRRPLPPPRPGQGPRRGPRPKPVPWANPRAPSACSVDGDPAVTRWWPKANSLPVPGTQSLVGEGRPSSVRPSSTRGSAVVRRAVSEAQD